MSHLGAHLYSEDSTDIIESATELFEIDDFTSPSDWEKVGIYLSICNIVTLANLNCYGNFHLFY